MKFAYADPPYPGCAHLYPEKKEVDHKVLISQLCDEFSDGWALSTSSPALQQVLALCPEDVRVMAWVKPFCSFKPNVNPAYAWEPVLVRGGRRRTREQLTVRDWVSENITLKKGLTGAKPVGFCLWLLDVLNVEIGDELVDLFPGTGIVTEEFNKRMNGENNVSSY
tara:strand:- start:29 stop:526 length:498 start_codon:yes stop_codon:yes gene_type:complete